MVDENFYFCDDVFCTHSFLNVDGYLSLCFLQIIYIYHQRQQVVVVLPVRVWVNYHI